MVILYTYITQCFLVNYSVEWYTIIFVKIYVVALFNLNFYFYFLILKTPILVHTVQHPLLYMANSTENRA